MTISYLSHTADAKILVTADSFDDAFSQMAQALCGLIVNDAVLSQMEVSFEVREKSLDLLLFSFVDAWVHCCEVDGVIACAARATFSKDEDCVILSGFFCGDLVSKYDTHGNVKAPTLHELQAQQLSNGVELQITVDM